MITPEEAARIKVAIRRLIRAEIDASWIGAQETIFHDSIKTELRSAKASLANILSPNTQKKAEPGESEEET